MIFWLDNNENRLGEPNENYGRELLELFSMGAGNYSEDDIKNASRAFTGWTFTQPIPLYPQGHHPSEFVFKPQEHDYGPKTFLGESGNFDGEDIIDIIVRQEATARFIARHLYNFYVADEPQVPAWPIEPPQDQEAIDAIVQTYFDTGGDMRAIMRMILLSDFFKEARFKKVKSPTELVTGVLKLGGSITAPQPGIGRYQAATGLMGAAAAEPADRRGLAHRARVDRRRHAERAYQLRRGTYRRRGEGRAFRRSSGVWAAMATAARRASRPRTSPSAVLP